MTQISSKVQKEVKVSDLEKRLRQKLGIEDLPVAPPAIRFRHLGAFWQHWALHKRSCDATGAEIISVFPQKCPYPVWLRDHWMKHADPPGAVFQENRKVFPQMWDLFQQCPIPHNFGTGNENCAYTDDWWYSRNCFLCHSGFDCQDLKYCYRTYGVRDSQFCTFTFDSELCVDFADCRNCFNVVYAVHSKECRDSAFLYDCRNCSDCLFCFNLRHKQYCIGNKQLSKEEYEVQKKKWDFSRRLVYAQTKERFNAWVMSSAFHRALSIHQCEDSSGDYLGNSKNCENCYFVYDSRDCVNCVRGGEGMRDSLDCVAFDLNIELAYSTVFISDNCYDIKFGYNITSSKHLEYCAFCWHCEYCFGCSGLVGKKYYIFNTPYSPEEYKKRKQVIVDHMEKTGEYGQFFPEHFAANIYDESWSGFYFPLSKEEQKELGFRTQEEETERENEIFSSVEDMPDSSHDADASLSEKVFWDHKSRKPFSVQKDDVSFAQKLGVPLPHQYYITRLQENAQWLPFSGELMGSACSRCSKRIQTSLPKEYEGKILCEDCYGSL